MAPRDSLAVRLVREAAEKPLNGASHVLVGLLVLDLGGGPQAPGASLPERAQLGAGGQGKVCFLHFGGCLEDGDFPPFLMENFLVVVAALRHARELAGDHLKHLRVRDVLVGAVPLPGAHTAAVPAARDPDPALLALVGAPGEG